MAEKLNPEQEMFAQHLALHQNQAAAYRYAYNTDEMSPETVWANASRLAKKDKVKLRVEELSLRIKKQAEDKFDLTADKLLAHIKNIAYLDIGDFFNWETETCPILLGQRTNVTLKDLSQLSLLQRQMIASVKQTRGATDSVELTFVSKDKAIDRLATYLGINNVKVDVDVTHIQQEKDAAAAFESDFTSIKEKLLNKAAILKNTQEGTIQ